MNTHTHRTIYHTHKKISQKHFIKSLFYFLFAIFIILISIIILAISTIQLPDFKGFENRNVSNSTKIYDRTGKVVLYNVNENVKRTSVNFDKISQHMKDATISIEDSHFYEHHGIRPTSIVRASLANLISGQYSQGASTITQQVVKNALLTREKTLSRKIKEWLMAIKLDAQVSKDDILNIYLNESPYGGSIYGVEEASQSYFGKDAKDLSITESAYLAAIPQAPTHYSPFGSYLTDLENRKNLVLKRMFELNHINDNEYNLSKKEKVTFKSRDDNNGKALHFVFYIREYLESKYGRDMVESGGLKIISTLDWDMQKAAEEIVKRGAIANETKFKAKNAALVAIDPKTSQILSMVGSRDYFDKSIDGNFNVSTALRQPGSTFKPFVYYLAFNKGLTPETTIFDLPTQFSTNCDAVGIPNINHTKEDCYMPVNYDGKWRGPVSLRNALGQSLNIPAVKLQYIDGIADTISLVRSLGINTIQNDGTYGLSLALGAGLVRPLDIINAYGTFANKGIYNNVSSILEIKDKDNNLLESYISNPKQILDENYVNMINSILSDNVAKTPAYGFNNKMNFGDRPVAAKTGTTNDYKDVWTIGYTPSLVVGMWAGNNDNTPIDKKVAGLVVTPIWREFMDVALKNKPIESFAGYIVNPTAPDYTRGVYCNNTQGAHSLLYDIGRSNSEQTKLWQYPISVWAASTSCPSLGEFNFLLENNINPINSTSIPTTTIN